MRSEIDKENWLFVGTINPLMIDMAIEALQADTLEVVRCKDCQHKYDSGNGTTQYYVCDFMDAQFDDKGYCHHGERNDE